jgi:hypothetical protein
MKKLALSTLAASAMFAQTAYAETTKQEFMAMSKVASLCKTLKSSGIKVAVVFNGSNATSVADKDSLLSLVKSKKYEVSAVDIANVASTDANLVILADTLSADDQAKVASTFTGNPVLTVSTDMACVESGKCMLGVDVKPVIKLLVDSNLLEKSGLKFDSAFNFMVKQI